MSKELTFSSVCKFIKNDSEESIAALDNLCGFGIVCAIISTTPTLSPLLAIKNELIKTGNKLLNVLTGKDEKDYIARMQRMEAAYGLICYTAFFDTIDQEICDQLRDAIALTNQNKQVLAELDMHEEDNHSAFDETIPFPHPTSSTSNTKTELFSLYKRLSSNFAKYLDLMAETFKTQNIAIELSKFKENKLKDLPEKALKRFESQYFHLSLKYEEFRVWLEICHREQLSEFQTHYYKIQTQSDSQIDIGFRNLTQAVQSLAQTFETIDYENISEALKRRYAEDIKKPVIEERDISKTNSNSITFPAICDTFIPQSYKVVQYSENDLRLEQESTWNDLKVRNDLSGFMLRYLTSPYSIKSPLLILGHPGGGKSLLTKVLAAQLACDSYTVVRIPLREVNTELGIDTLVINQIEKDTGEHVHSWAAFARQFAARPLVILLDGFDELIQAKGAIFAGYLEKIKQFQDEQAVHLRPVRILITSRITLIDKAVVPIDCCVLRLLAFSQKQQVQWIKIWNKTNTKYFKVNAQTVKPFKLPTSTDKEEKILELAEQPLLLLMLALYDSESNDLLKHQNLDRTVLYDSLLRRFVRRERRRYMETFDYQPEEEQNQIIDYEIKRLGVIAIGMYNRRKLHIRSHKLTSDLEFFECNRPETVAVGQKLSDAHALLGSFFFIHRSNAFESSPSSTEANSAFEFLHNTFGEFLTADFILKTINEQCEWLYAVKSNQKLYYKTLLSFREPDKLSAQWYNCLMFEPLHSRPVIPQMIKEWFEHLIASYELNRREFLASFDEILKLQIKMVLQNRVFPQAMQSNATLNFTDMPIMGMIATYTLNLIIIRTIIGPNGFTFSEEDYIETPTDINSSTNDVRLWDRLTLLWRAWFSIDSLSVLSNIIDVKRDQNVVSLGWRQSIKSSEDKFKKMFNTAEVLADNVAIGLIGQHLNNVNATVHRDFEYYLRKEGIELEFEFLLRKLKHHIQANSTLETVGNIILVGLDNINSSFVRDDLLFEFLTLSTDFLHTNVPTPMLSDNIPNKVLPLNSLLNKMHIRPTEGVLWLRLIKKCNNSLWFTNYGEQLLDCLERTEGFRLNFAHWIEWLEFLIDCSNSGPKVSKYARARHWRLIVYSVFPRKIIAKRFIPLINIKPELAFVIVDNFKRYTLSVSHWFFELKMHIENKVSLTELATILFEKRQINALYLIKILRLLNCEEILRRIGIQYRGILDTGKIESMRPCGNIPLYSFSVNEIPLGFIEDICWYANELPDQKLKRNLAVHWNDTSTAIHKNS